MATLLPIPVDVNIAEAGLFGILSGPPVRGEGAGNHGRRILNEGFGLTPVLQCMKRPAPLATVGPCLRLTGWCASLPRANRGEGSVPTDAKAIKLLY